MILIKRYNNINSITINTNLIDPNINDKRINQNHYVLKNNNFRHNSNHNGFRNNEVNYKTSTDIVILMKLFSIHPSKHLSKTSTVHSTNNLITSQFYHNNFKKKPHKQSMDLTSPDLNILNVHKYTSLNHEIFITNNWKRNIIQLKLSQPPELNPANHRLNSKVWNHLTQLYKRHTQLTSTQECAKV